jgi:ABC-2 type transport system ATP-binding protein
VSQPAIEISDLVIARGAVNAIDSISVDISPGRITGLIGPSGSGKSSLMRAIVGVQLITSGRIHVLGLQAGKPALRTRIGYVTQSPSVYRDLTVGENLRYFAQILRAPKSDVDRVLDAVDLSGLQNRLVRTLSGGQEGRVSLATALLGRPELLILDEPTVGLDPVLRRDLWDFFHSLADAGTTLLISSHVMDEASRCHDLLLLRDGGLLAHGTPDDLLARTGCLDIESAFLALVHGGAS